MNPLVRNLKRCSLLGVLLLALFSSATASAGDLQDRLDLKRQKLDHAQQREGVQSSTLQRLSTQVDDLTGQVAALRNREATVEAELAEVQARLDGAASDLQIARKRLKRAKAALRSQLVSIYKSADTDALTVILSSDGYDDLLGRATYLSAIQSEGDQVAGQIEDLRDQKLSTVASIRSARDEVAARHAELQRTREQLEQQESSLLAAHRRERHALAMTKTHIGSLQGDVSDLERKVQAELQVAQSAAPGVAAAPGAESSSSGLIWPVSGTVTSPFGPRWGTIHEGIDIGAAEGTPIQAAAGGTVVMAGWNGGYGNYTCIDHGSGFSTCYAHQSSIGVTVGQDVGQGEIIGEVGNTGHSFGAHLHFETRVNGTAEDPLGYL